MCSFSFNTVGTKLHSVHNFFHITVFQDFSLLGTYKSTSIVSVAVRFHFMAGLLLNQFPAKAQADLGSLLL